MDQLSAEATRRKYMETHEVVLFQTALLFKVLHSIGDDTLLFELIPEQGKDEPYVEYLNRIKPNHVIKNYLDFFKVPIVDKGSIKIVDGFDDKTRDLGDRARIYKKSDIKKILVLFGLTLEQVISGTTDVGVNMPPIVPDEQ